VIYLKKRAIVIGAGLAGMSAAIRLAGDGYAVTMLEKNANVGGKLNQRSGKGFTFDTFNDAVGTRTTLLKCSS